LGDCVGKAWTLLLKLCSRFRQSLIRCFYYLFRGLVRPCCFIFLSICTHAFFFTFHRKPLGEPAPQAPNLALAVVLLIVIAVQAIFNAWQGETDISSPYTYKIADKFCYNKKIIPPRRSWPLFPGCCQRMFLSFVMATPASK
jgi:hypothetical protein